MVTTARRAAAGRARLYRRGRLESTHVDVTAVGDLLAEPDTVLWLDQEAPDDAVLSVLAAQLGLSRLALEDTLRAGQRPKVTRHGHYLLLTLFGTRVDPVTGALTTSELGVLAGDRWVITVRKTGDVDMAAVERVWDDTADLAGHGVAHLLHGLLDHVVEQHVEAAEQLDEAIEAIEAGLFDPRSQTAEVQRRCYEMRKALVGLRRVALPMREVLLTFTRRDLHTVDEVMTPYFADVYEQVLRVAEWTESLRDLVGTIQDSALQVQNNLINEVMRRLSAYAAVFAASTAITGFYGMNVAFPQSGSVAGAVTATLLLVVTALVLVLLFRRRRWL